MCGYMRERVLVHALWGWEGAEGGHPKAEEPPHLVAPWPVEAPASAVSGTASPRGCPSAISFWLFSGRWNHSGEEGALASLAPDPLEH